MSYRCFCLRKEGMDQAIENLANSNFRLDAQCQPPRNISLLKFVDVHTVTSWEKIE